MLYTLALHDFKGQLISKKYTRRFIITFFGTFSTSPNPIFTFVMYNQTDYDEDNNSSLAHHILITNKMLLFNTHLSRHTWHRKTRRSKAASQWYQLLCGANIKPDQTIWDKRCHRSKKWKKNEKWEFGKFHEISIDL
jgi:hypothetical protein